MFREGQQIGLYTLIRKLGRGGFGEVWLAEKKSKFVTTKVAVKLPLDEQIDHAAIKQEAVLWEQASGHPNVLPIIDADEYDGQVVIVSEYAPDGSLEELLRKENILPIKRAVELTIGILNGLDFLHSKQIIHRDIKPANILLQRETPRLADFGISRVMKTTNVSVNMVGTPFYMAPEAFDGKRTMQTDVWSVGVVLYQMLSGSLPFPHQELTELLGAIIMKEPDVLPDSVPSQLREIISRALAKKSEERYQSVVKMRDDLTEFLVSISQSKIRREVKNEKETNKTEEITQVLSTSPVIETQASPTMRSPVPFADTSERPTEVTEKLTENLALPQLDSGNSKRSPGILRYLVPFALLLLLVTGGLYLFINRQISGTNKSGSSETIQSSDSTMSDTNQPADSTILDNAKLIPYRKGDKFGFSDAKKKVIIEPKYEMALRFHEGLAAVELNKKRGVIDKTGTEVIPLKYDTWVEFSEGLASVALNGKAGFIDKTGSEVIPLKYDFVRQFNEGLAGVEINGKHGFIDKTGTEVIPLKYDKVWDFNDGLATVELNKKWGFIDRMGTEVIPLKYDILVEFREGLASVALNGKAGFIDKTGSEVIPLKYDFVRQFNEGLAGVELNGKHGFIDKTGTEVIPLKYDYAGDFNDGIAAVESNKKNGLIDKTGAEVIWSKYEYLGRFVEGLAVVLLNKKFGFIDKSGTEVIPLKFDHVTEFSEGLALVELNKTFYIDQAGTEYYEP